MTEKNEQNGKFPALVALMSRLRGPDGCPWDRKQTPGSLTPYLIEECYEVVDALEEGAPEKIKEELGDLLFQILFQAQLAAEKGEFTVWDVIDANREKMIRRHPHVFGNASLATDKEVLANWEEIKKKEKVHRTSLLDGVPRNLPALLRAHRLQELAARVGFDWNRMDDALVKLDEELDEFKRSLKTGNADDIEEELGDIYFMLVNIARMLMVNPEDALKRAISKFIHRFRYMEEWAGANGKELSAMTIEEMEALWQKSKQEQ